MVNQGDLSCKFFRMIEKFKRTRNKKKKKE